MGIIPFPDPGPEPGSESVFDNLFGPPMGAIFGTLFSAVAALIPDGMTVGDALHEVAKLPVKDVLEALDLLPPAQDAS